MLTVRWNATFSMIASILDNEAAVNALDAETFRSLASRDFLQPFLSFTNTISGSLVHVGYVTLIRHEMPSESA